MLDLWELAAIGAKFALYLGVITAAGTVMAALLFRLDRYRELALKFAVLGLIAAVLGFSLRGAMLTGDASGMTDPTMLGILWTTPVGTALVYRLAGLCLLIAGLFAGRYGVWLSVFGGVVAIWSFVQIGHVPDHGVALLNIALALHLIAIALWIGILTPLKRLSTTPETWNDAASLGHRFGLVAMGTVPALIIAGVYMAYSLLGSASLLISTGYGQALILKVVLIALLLGLAAANKLRFIPKLRGGDPTAARHLSKSITLEWVIILAVLCVTAALTSTFSLPT